MVARTLPPPLRAAVDDLDEATRLLERLAGWLPAILGEAVATEWLDAYARDLVTVRARVLTAWSSRETSTALASHALRRSVDGVLERLALGPE